MLGEATPPHRSPRAGWLRVCRARIQSRGSQTARPVGLISATPQFRHRAHCEAGFSSDKSHAGRSMHVPARWDELTAIAPPSEVLPSVLWGAFEHSRQLGSCVAALLAGFDELGDFGED